MHKHPLLRGVSAFTLTMLATPALAATEPAADQPAVASTSAAPAANDASTGEIIVTAQRRSEKLRDVPISMTALSGDALNKLRANDISRVEFATPGFTWGSQGSDSFPAIRGVRTSLVSAQNDPVIGFYIDGIYQSRTQQQSIPLFDIARVEVLRGPQGTLYGRNTFGGNVSIVTAEPTHDFGVGANLEKGNYNQSRVDGYINLPVTDTLAVRFSGVFQRHDGYVHSTTPGVVLDDLNENAERVAVKWTPTSDLEVTLHAGTWRRDDAGAGSYGYKVAGTLINPATGYQSINGQPYAVNPSVPNGSPNVAGRDIGKPVTGGAWTNDWDYQPFEHIAEDYVSGQIAYNLGPVTLKSITGYTHFRAHRSADNDQSSVTFEGLGYGSGVQEANTRSNAFTQEVQLASNAKGRLEWIVGAYYLHDSIFETYQQKITAPGATTTGFRADAGLTTDAYAIYGQGTFQLVPDLLRVIAGARYSHEKKAFNFADWADAAPGTYNFMSPYSVTSGAPSFSSGTWRAGLQFTPDRNTMIYATASTGFESGGVNDTGGNPAIPSSYAPQKVWAYEAGIKSKILGGKGEIEASGFYNKFSNLQINVYTPLVSYFGSAGQARSYGGELALRLDPVPNLHINTTLSFMNARYTRYISGNNFYGASGGADPVSVDLAGKKIPQSPDFKATVLASYDIDLGKAGTLTPSGNWLHSGGYYTTDYNTVLDYQKAYDKLGASLRWSAAKGNNTYIEAYGDNLTNQATLLSGVVGRLERIQVSYGAPRTYGVRVGTKF
ncbi:TonB-dependent receptor [Novosphingobium sp.]|uniref:TonB-dependent receptor n=1 Tax=Novosphingobium sp. TaxID=1874826 RepID=UPI0031DA8FF9